MVFSDKNNKSLLEGGLGEFQAKQDKSSFQLKKPQLSKKQQKENLRHERAIELDIVQALNLVTTKGQGAVLKALLEVHNRYPRSHKPLFQIGLIQMSQMDYHGAEGIMAEAYNRAPLEPEVIIHLATAQIILGKTEEAEAHIKNLLQINSNPRTLIAAANLSRMMGNKKEAIAKVKEALEVDPDHIHAMAILSDLTGPKTDDPLFKKLKKISQNGQKVSKEYMTMVHFSLARALFKMKDYKTSFYHYHRGNQIKAKMVPYSEKNMKRSAEQAEEIFSIFSAETMKKLRKQSTNKDRKPVPIFIAGMPRSGTTLVEQIISMNPDVASGGEMSEFVKSGQIEGTSGHDFSSRLEAAKEAENFNKTGKVYLDRLKKIYPYAGYVTDKMPFNYIWAGLISLALPQAKIVIMKRNPMDCGLSIYRQNFSAQTPWYNDLKGIGQAYKVFNKYLNYWQEALGDKVFVLDYDKLVVSPEKELRALIKYLNFEWSDEYLQFHESGGRVTTASIEQVRNEINKGSLELWKNFEEELEPLYNEVKHLMSSEK